MENEATLERINKMYPSSDGAKLAKVGNWAAAAEYFGGFGCCGLWKACRIAAGLDDNWGSYCKTKKETRLSAQNQ